MTKEAYRGNPIAQGVLTELQRSFFGAQYKLVPVINKNVVKQVQATIRHLDNKARVTTDNEYATVFEGLAFDPHRVRSQAFTIFDKVTRKPVAVSAFILAPTKWILSKRYFEKASDGIIIRDFRHLSHNDQQPNFLFFPGWTYVDPGYRLQFALPGFRAIKNVMTYIRANAPNHTWAEEIPRGTWPRNRETETVALAKNPVGTHIFADQLPFELSAMGINSPGSSSSVKVARHLGLEKITNISSVSTLGPVFASQLA